MGKQRPEVCVMSDLRLLEEITEIVNTTEIFDSNEHLMYETERRTRDIDFFIIFNAYTFTGLISSGLKETDVKKLTDPGISLEKKWQIFCPYWNFIKYSDDANVIKIAVLVGTIFL